VANAPGTSTAGRPAAASSQNDVGSPVGDADLLDERLQNVVRARDASLEVGIVALAAEVDHGRPGVGPGVEREVVEQAGTERAAEDEHDASVRRHPEASTCLLAFQGL
jgi:hypothetical protein